MFRIGSRLEGEGGAGRVGACFQVLARDKKQNHGCRLNVRRGEKACWSCGATVGAWRGEGGGWWGDGFRKPLGAKLPKCCNSCRFDLFLSEAIQKPLKCVRFLGKRPWRPTCPPHVPHPCASPRDPCTTPAQTLHGGARRLHGGLHGGRTKPREACTEVHGGCTEVARRLHEGARGLHGGARRLHGGCTEVARRCTEVARRLHGGFVPLAQRVVFCP